MMFDIKIFKKKKERYKCWRAYQIQMAESMAKSKNEWDLYIMEIYQSKLCRKGWQNSQKIFEVAQTIPTLVSSEK